MVRLVGVVHLLVLACLAAYVVLLPLLTSRPPAGGRALRPVRGPRGRRPRAGAGPGYP